MDEENQTIWNILLIEDSEKDYLYIRALLEQAKSHMFQMKWVRESTEIASYACNPQYDAVLIEYRFDAAHSMELLDEIEKSCPSAPILLIVGWIPAEIQAIAREHGAYSFIEKTSMGSETLKNAIQAIIDKNQV